MMWNSWQAFLSMGGKGAFVWGSYGVTLVLVVLELVLLNRHRKQTIARLLRLRRANLSERS